MGPMAVCPRCVRGSRGHGWTIGCHADRTPWQPDLLEVIDGRKPGTSLPQDGGPRASVRRKKENVVLDFDPQQPQDMPVACLWNRSPVADQSVDLFQLCCDHRRAAT